MCNPVKIDNWYWFGEDEILKNISNIPPVDSLVTNSIFSLDASRIRLNYCSWLPLKKDDNTNFWQEKMSPGFSKATSRVSYFYCFCELGTRSLPYNLPIDFLLSQPVPGDSLELHLGRLCSWARADIKSFQSISFLCPVPSSQQHNSSQQQAGAGQMLLGLCWPGQ